MREFIIGNNEAGQRFDKYLFKLLRNATPSLLYKQLRNKNITLNKTKAKGNEILKLNDSVCVFMSEETIDKFMGTSSNKEPELDLSRFCVVYEDDNILIADKPVGVLSQKAEPKDISMNEYLIAYLLNSGLKADTLNTFRPSFCNRLDRNTSGLMIAGKSLAGLQKMSEIIKDRSIHKYYLAIVKGQLSENIVLKGYLVKDEKLNKVTVSEKPVPGADLIDTEIYPLRTIGDLTLIRVKLITGKPHQIRAHLASIKHPILGDAKYGDTSLNRELKAKYQLLHSYELVFPSLSGEFTNISNMTLKSQYPERFTKYFEE